MKSPAWIPMTAAVVLAASAVQAAASRDDNEARLTRMLEGRVAGEPVNCIPSFKGDRLEVIEYVGLVYDGGDVIYVARPTNPETLRRDDVVVINRFGSQLCHSDIIRTVDRTGGYHTGVLFLEKFVPYRKAQ